jgi:thioredoxin 1
MDLKHETKHVFKIIPFAVALSACFFLFGQYVGRAANALELDSLAKIKSEMAKPGPRVLMYYADWCGPCRLLHPTYVKFAQETKGVRFYEMNIDKAMLKEHAVGDVYVPTIYYGDSENQIRNRPCVIGAMGRSLNKLKADLKKCMENK